VSARTTEVTIRNEVTRVKVTICLYILFSSNSIVRMRGASNSNLLFGCPELYQITYPAVNQNLISIEIEAKVSKARH